MTHVYNTTVPGQVARYTYSAMNQRVMKFTDTDDDGALDDKTVYIYCHQKVCEEQGLAGNFKRDYVHGGQFIDEVVMTSDVAGAIGTFSLTDLRYSVYAVVDASGVVQERYKYDPYGKRTVMNAGYGVMSDTTINQRYGYTGRRHDEESTNMMYFRARYYSGELGRFVSRDKLGYIEGLNLYRGYFVPWTVDPTGEASVPLPGPFPPNIPPGTHFPPPPGTPPYVPQPPGDNNSNSLACLSIGPLSAAAYLAGTACAECLSLAATGGPYACLICTVPCVAAAEAALALANAIYECATGDPGPIPSLPPGGAPSGQE